MNSLPLLTPQAAYDQRGLETLKREAARDGSGALRTVVSKLEGLFVEMMLKSMREASLGDDALNSSQSRMFTSMYDQQIAQRIADTGRLGFADQILAQMRGTTQSVVPGCRTLPAPPVPMTHSAAASLPPRTDTGSFIARLLQPALAVARKSGLSHQLILAQAALESDWGRREIKTPDGQASHNLFAVKATRHWEGATTEVTTTEYKDGVAFKTKGQFKVYPSYAAAIADYVALLTHNPRYQKVREAVQPEKAAHALQSAGYATDPSYAKKLISVIQQIKQRAGEISTAPVPDISSLF